MTSSRSDVEPAARHHPAGTRRGGGAATGRRHSVAARRRRGQLVVLVVLGPGTSRCRSRARRSAAAFSARRPDLRLARHRRPLPRSRRTTIPGSTTRRASSGTRPVGARGAPRRGRGRPPALEPVPGHRCTARRPTCRAACSIPVPVRAARASRPRSSQDLTLLFGLMLIGAAAYFAGAHAPTRRARGGADRQRVRAVRLVLRLFERRVVPHLHVPPAPAGVRRVDHSVATAAPGRVARHSPSPGCSWSACPSPPSWRWWRRERSAPCGSSWASAPALSGSKAALHLAGGVPIGLALAAPAPRCSSGSTCRCRSTPTRSWRTCRPRRIADRLPQLDDAAHQPDSERRLTARSPGTGSARAPWSSRSCRSRPAARVEATQRGVAARRGRRGASRCRSTAADSWRGPATCPVWSQALWPAFGTPIIALVIALLAGSGCRRSPTGTVRAGPRVDRVVGALAVATVLAVVATDRDLAFTHGVIIRTAGGRRRWSSVLASPIVLCLPTLRRGSAVIVVAIVIVELVVIAPRGFYGPREDPVSRRSRLTTFLTDHTGDNSRIFSTDGVLFPDTAASTGSPIPDDRRAVRRPVLEVPAVVRVARHRSIV